MGHIALDVRGGAVNGVGLPEPDPGALVPDDLLGLSVDLQALGIVGLGAAGFEQI